MIINISVISNAFTGADIVLTLIFVLLSSNVVTIICYVLLSLTSLFYTATIKSMSSVILPPPLLLITVYWSHSDLPYICSTIITRILCWLPFFFESLSFPLSISLYLFLHVSFFPNLTLSLSTYLPSFPLLNHFQSINMHISIFILFSLCSWLSSFLSLFYSLLFCFCSVSVLFLVSSRRRFF